MLFNIKTFVLLGVWFASPSYADVIVLDFEGVGNSAQLQNFYNAGTDSLGLSGIDYGIQFGLNALALRDRDMGGSGNFANEPSSDTVMFFTTGSAILNYAPGFDTGFSFFYSAKYAATIYIYDEVNAAGNLLASINILPQYTEKCGGDPTGTYCNWTPVGVSFDSMAKSVDFGGTVLHTGYDDVTFGSAIPGGVEQKLMFQAAAVPLPQPSTWALIGLGFIGLITTLRCKTDGTCKYRNAFIKNYAHIGVYILPVRVFAKFAGSLLQSPYMSYRLPLQDTLALRKDPKPR